MLRLGLALVFLWLILGIVSLVKRAAQWFIWLGNLLLRHVASQVLWVDVFLVVLLPLDLGRFDRVACLCLTLNIVVDVYLFGRVFQRLIRARVHT